MDKTEIPILLQSKSRKNEIDKTTFSSFFYKYKKDKFLVKISLFENDRYDKTTMVLFVWTENGWQKMWSYKLEEMLKDRISFFEKEINRLKENHGALWIQQYDSFKALNLPSYVNEMLSLSEKDMKDWSD
jgi:hypothetical protein